MAQAPGLAHCRPCLRGVTLGFIPLVVLCTVTPLDLSLSARFYDAAAPQGWFLGHAVPWSWLYRYGEYPAMLMASGAMGVLLGSTVRRAWGPYRRPCLFLVLVVVLGPGLVVNGVLKPYWGRPRPRQIVQFGGTHAYRPWWQPGGPGAGKSFPSGHTANAFALLAGALLIPRRHRVWPRVLALVSVLGYGALMGVARIVQGGHFASDVIWSGGLMCFLAIGLQAALSAYPDSAVVACGAQG